MSAPGDQIQRPRQPKILLIAIGALAAQANARQSPTLPAVRCDKPPALDGNLNDPAWKTAPVAAPFIDPYTGEPPPDQTEVRIVYDDQAVYVAFLCHDSQPNKIVGREITPDAQFNGEDTVTFDIDPFHTRHGDSISSFTVNAINTRAELLAGGRAAKVEWRGLWESVTRRIADGWICEMKIPWRILNYPDSATPVDMDVNFDRHQARTFINSQWANETPQEQPEMVGTWTGVQPPKADQRKRVQFLAYDAPQYGYGTFSNRAGIDARYAFTPQFTGLASLSPDFRNIEQEIAGINFVHTERFIDDARPFFTEGNEFFNPVGQYNFGQPFYSQRITNFDLGTKVFGELGDKTLLGAFATEQSNGPTAAMLDVHRTLTPTSGADFYMTSYDDTGLHDRLFGTDASVRAPSGLFTGTHLALEDTGHS